MRWFTKRLYRERRRVLIVAVATFASGYFAFFKSTKDLLGLPFPITAGLAFMVGLTAALTILVVLFPKVRHSAESVALSLPILSLMGAFGSDMEGGFSTSNGVFGILVCYLIFVVYGGTVADRYLPRRPKRMRSFATSKLQPKELWPYLTVTPDTFANYGGEGTLSMEWIEPGVSFLEIERVDELTKIEEIQTIKINEPYRRYCVSFKVPYATDSASLSSGSLEIKMIPTGFGSKLETVRLFDQATIRAHIFNWIDDAMGRVDDEKIYNAESAYL